MAYKFEKYSRGGGIIDVTALPSGTPVVGTWTISEFDAIEDPTIINQEVKNIYFNTTLSTDEVVEILSKLTFIPVDDGVTGVFAAYGYDLSKQSEVVLAFMQIGTTEYGIMSMSGDGESFLFATAGLAAEMGTTGGWNPDFNGTYAVNGILFKPGEVLEGIPVDNQQAKYSRLMSLTPDFGAGKENVVYRVTEKVDADVYFRYSTEDPDGYQNMKQLAASGGLVSNPVYYVVDALPESPEVSNLATLNPVHCYIVNNIAYVYGNTGSGNVWLTAAELLALSDIQTTNNGFTADITKETTIGLFVTYKTNITLHYYKDGEWHGGGGSGIVDVEELPAGYTDIEVYVRQDASTYTTLLQLCQNAFGATPDITYYVVDTLPTVGKLSDFNSLTFAHCYIANDVPYLYGDVGGSNMWVPLNAAIAELTGESLSDKGFTSDIATTTEAGIYVTYKKGEMPDESVIYRTKSDGVQVWFKNGSDKMSIEVWLTAMGATHNTIYHIVDSLPSNPEISGGSSNDILTFHVYVLNSTGVPYSSNNGETYSVFSLVEPVRGWVDSTDEMAEDGTYVLRVKGGGGTAYGIPTANADVYRFEDGKWTEPDTPADDEISALNAQIETLEGTVAEKAAEIDTLKDTIAKNTAEIKPLEEENALLSARLAGLDSGDEGGENFARYASLKNTDTGIEITDIIDTSITSITIPDGITSIGNNAFEGCSGLTSITIPDGVTSIGSHAFDGCNNLTSINIPDGVTSIGDSAFRNCSAITTISIPDGVTRIYDSTFEDCTSLTSITIPDSVTGIGGYAFEGCSALTSVTIPDSVTGIGSYAFEGCSALTSVTIPDSVTIIGSYAFRNCNNLTSINIPDGVTSIDQAAFYNCSSLTSITIPDGVTSIGSSAFYGCSSLTSITIPDGVTSIRGDAFYNCNNLTSITIPDSVTSIGGHAFYNCNNLTSINIPDGVTSIGLYAFRGCSSLESIIVADGNTSYHSVGNCLIETASKTLIVGCNNSVIPQDGSVTSIGDSAFYGCSNLVSVTIPDSVTSIGNYAFEGCSALTSVNISKNSQLTRIGQGAFDGCASLPTINIPDSVTSIGSFAFEGCSALTSVTIPDSVTSIGGYAFRNCNNLTSINIPDGVTSIGNSAFYGCSNLVSVTIPDSVTNIGGDAFKGCSALTSVNISENSQLTSIGSGAFDDCTSLPTINIPDSVTRIGWYAFECCSALTSVNIGENSQLTSIGQGAFKNCTSLVSITIPDSVTGISYHAFEGCSALTSVAIPDGVTIIYDSTFEDCTSLTSVTFGENSQLTRIDGSAFSGCTSLTSITIPESVTSIYSAFYGCSALTTISIPDGVTRIYDSTFKGCSALTSVIIGNGVTSIGRSAFEGCSSLESVTIPDGVTSMGRSAFEGCSSLTSVTIGNGVTSLSGWEFSGCTSLTSVTFGENSQLTSIGTYTFKNCTSLTSISIPDSVTSIDSAFRDCSALTSVTFGENSQLTSIDGAFDGCTSLPTINIPDSVTIIGHFAFNRCSVLTSIVYGGTKAQWKAITFGDHWNQHTGKYTIYCTDGTITRGGIET